MKLFYLQSFMTGDWVEEFQLNIILIIILSILNLSDLNPWCQWRQVSGYFKV